MTDFAHIKFTDNGWETQSIANHCEGTASLAESMANAFGAGSWARLCGLWHDVGKYSWPFQEHIAASSGYDSTAKDPGTVDHSTAGALYAMKRLREMCLPIAYCICGHHSGLMDYISDGRTCLSFHLSARERPLLEAVLPYIKEQSSLPHLPAPNFDNHSRTPKAWHLWIRMLFSALVDADWLDTERFMAPNNYAARGRFVSLVELKERLDQWLHRFDTVPATHVNTIRASVQALCRQHGLDEQGIYSLTVPTGGGKTLSSLIWAMEHALKHDLQRIIIAIPYTSIVSQTANTLRDVFGENNVVEHHCYVDFDGMPTEQRRRMRYATENWDAPIIVTTNVQLFESLYSNKTSSCRKLHNIAKSVLILDEVQMLPVENLHPIIDILDSLRKYMGTSILLTTATQPAFSDVIGSGQAQFKGLECKELIPDTTTLFSEMRRVRIAFEDNVFTYETLANRLSQYPQVLCVVNTRTDARNLYDAMPDKQQVVHLSRNMCQEHISNKLENIKKRLRERMPVCVISTQLIEAGVDIDFPVVWRAMAGLDSIAQSAGRCNREGRMKVGKVHVFKIEGSRPRGILAKATEASQDLLCQGKSDFIDPQTAKDYFRLFYAKLNDTDKSGVTQLLYRPCPQFDEAAKAFRMIDDNTLTLYVPYASGKGLLKKLIHGEYTADLLRRLQRFSVNLPIGRRKDLEQLGAIKFSECVYILPDDNCNYADDIGVRLENKWLEETLII